MPLRVLQPFGGHAIGDEINDAAAISAVLASDQVAFVVAIPEPERTPPASELEGA